MNTKKLFFGVLAIAFLAMTAVATDVVDIQKDTKTSIDKKKILKL